MISWDDMRIFIAVARSGSFSAAGIRVGMDATTVARRTRRLETALKATLFARSRKGLQLTAAGAHLAEAGARVEAAMSEVSQEGSANAVSGTIRLSVPEGFGGAVIAPELPKLIRRRPNLMVELVASSTILSPTTREVDISVTSRLPEASSRLIIEKLTDFELGLFAAPKYLKEFGTPTRRSDLAAHQFIGFVDDLLYTQDIQFIEAFDPTLKLHLKCSSVSVQTTLAAAGGGIGIFPKFMAPASLTPVLPEEVMTRTYWAAFHADLYDTVRIKTLRRWLFSVVNDNASRLLPSRSGQTP